MTTREHTTRIPIFGSRIPLPGQVPIVPKQNTRILAETKSNKQSTIITEKTVTIGVKSSETLIRDNRVTEAHLGRIVCTHDRKGILRFVGEVHFAAGVWCGIEVAGGTGRNDGSVDGVRYFACPLNSGLMTPQFKVFPVVVECDDPSGPHSMLLGIESNDNEVVEDRNDVTVMNKQTEGVSLDETYSAFALNTITSTPLTDDESNKRDSLDCDESLGILSPRQMSSLSCFAAGENYVLDNISAPAGVFDTIMTLDLSLKSNMDVTLVRIEETPSPEDLPLDTTPVIKMEQKKPPSSFITSITSITSLDTGYQGDGELSRPASRGADNSPSTRRCVPRPVPRRVDPMTDSDFYTESDADNHEDHHLRGDRHAQVIDGTLYGVDAQAAADIYANNRENMDSSGIFTDIETRTDNENQRPEDVSPSESSTKTISDDSQNHNLLNKAAINENTFNKPVDTTKVLSSPSSKMSSSPVSTRSPRHGDKDEAAKKYKMPNRNVASKVKAMLGPNNKENEKRPTVKKTAGRWDAVMNKISKTNVEPKNFKQVKSKVFNNVHTNVQKNNIDNAKVTGVPQKSPNNKLRRIRSRTNATTTTNKNIESLNSSLSDLSGASPAKKIGSAKKQRDVVRVNQVLTAAKLSPKANNHAINTEAKNKNNINLNNDVKSTASRNLYAGKDKKKESAKDIGRATVKGGQVALGTRPPQTPVDPLPVSKPVPRTAEALAVLVQHLVFNLEAFKTPMLKSELHQLKERLDAERGDYNAEIRRLVAERENSLRESAELEESIREDNITVLNALNLSHEERLRTVRVELQKSFEETLDILREENDSIREKIDEKNDRIRELELVHKELAKMRKDFEVKENVYKEKLNESMHEIQRLSKENESVFASRCGGDTDALREVQSVRAVLEMKQAEIAELRKCLVEATQKAEQLPYVEEKVLALTAKCEDLQHQLERKAEYEIILETEKKKLEKQYLEEVNQNKRLQQHNEVLKWKVQQNKEVVSKVLEEAEATAFNRSLLSSSFNERNRTASPSLERTLSFRERSLSKSASSPNARKAKNSCDMRDAEDLSPPTSPKVKGVVEKSDSVSYVLEMDESPEVMASRIVRRSFRNANPPKTTPTKSPSNKRPRMKSSPINITSITPISKDTNSQSRSAQIRHDDNLFIWDSSSNVPFEDVFDEDVEDIKVPALPSEIGLKDANTLPVPKHLAGEAMVSESNSEDEEASTSSSSGQL